MLFVCHPKKELAHRCVSSFSVFLPLSCLRGSVRLSLQPIRPGPRSRILYHFLYWPTRWTSSILPWICSFSKRLCMCRFTVYREIVNASAISGLVSP